jgi:hypothetical protein
MGLRIGPPGRVGTLGSELQIYGEINFNLPKGELLARASDKIVVGIKGDNVLVQFASKL